MQQFIFIPSFTQISPAYHFTLNHEKVCEKRGTTNKILITLILLLLLLLLFVLISHFVISLCNYLHIILHNNRIYRFNAPLSYYFLR